MPFAFTFSLVTTHEDARPKNESDALEYKEIKWNGPFKQKCGAFR